VIQDLVVCDVADVWTIAMDTDRARLVIAVQRVPGGGAHVWVDVKESDPEGEGDLFDSFLSPTNETDLRIDLETSTGWVRGAPFEVERIPAPRRRPATGVKIHLFPAVGDLVVISLTSEVLRLSKRVELPAWSTIGSEIETVLPDGQTVSYSGLHELDGRTDLYLTLVGTKYEDRPWTDVDHGRPAIRTSDTSFAQGMLVEVPYGIVGGLQFSTTLPAVTLHIET
jgi:hypothetical protein